MELKINQLLVQRGDHPELVQIISIDEIGIPTIEYDSDGSVHDYWSLPEIEEIFEEWKPGMILYSWTGKGGFTQEYKSGYYLTREIVLDERGSYKHFVYSTFLGKNMPGSSQEEFQRAYKLKAFW